MFTFNINFDLVVDLTHSEKWREEMLLKELLDIVGQRNSIVDDTEVDRLKYVVRLHD